MTAILDHRIRKDYDDDNRNRRFIIDGFPRSHDSAEVFEEQV
jgi:adenylate kinase family enzyme